MDLGLDGGTTHVTGASEGLGRPVVAWRLGAPGAVAAGPTGIGARR